MDLLNAVVSSPYRRGWLGTKCRLDETRWSKILNGRILPNRYELMLIREVLCRELRIIDEKDLLKSIERYAEKLHRSADKIIAGSQV